MSYRFHCRKPECGAEFHRHFSKDEFEKTQYSPNGWTCFKCGFARMAVMKSNAVVKDGFQAGYQRNIGKWCDSYSEYKRTIKAMGLIELGYEDLPEEKEDESFRDYWTADILKEVYDEQGINLDGELVKGLQSGEIGL